MADSMPVCDVLCEAAEYLTKLGANIKIRTENLKDKRIRKDKLRNTHAIHKAVDKVLLICKLSKKSIENVETGIKNLLLQMEKAGATFGPGPKNSETAESGVEFEYFTYNSHKLKIRDKISVDHYVSAKVVSTSMTLSIIEKYPVYYDCKLYRLRNKKKGRDLHDSVSGSDSPIIPVVDEVTDMVVKGAAEAKDKTSCENEHVKTKFTPEFETTATSEKLELSEETTAIQIDNKILTSHSNQSLCQVSGSKMKESNSAISTMLRSDDRKDEADCKTMSKMKNNKDGRRKFRHIKVIDSSSSSDSEKKCEKLCTQDLNVKMLSESDIIDKSSTKTDTKENDTITLLDTNDTGIKPMIKCVSLSKLLRPDIVKDLDINNTVESKKQKKENKYVKRKDTYSTSELKTDCAIKKHVLGKSDEIVNNDLNQALKKIEIDNFKPKEFNINIYRLPKITLSFLEKYNLKKITQMGSVICEVLDYSNKDDTDVNHDFEPKSKKLKVSGKENKPVDISKVKNALLNDSDSETSNSNNKELSKSTFITNDGILSNNINEEQATELFNKNLCSKETKNAQFTQESSKSNVEIVKKDVVEIKSAFSADCTLEVDPDRVKNALLEDSDSEIQHGKVHNNANSLNKSLQEDANCESVVEKERVGISDNIKKFLLDMSDSELQGTVTNAQFNSGCESQNLGDGQQSLNTVTSGIDEKNFNKVKNLLLKESDIEEKNIATKQNETEKYSDQNIDQDKQSLLHESDCGISNQEKIEDNCNKETDTYNELTEQPNNSLTLKRKQCSSSTKDTEIVKSNLLKDSSDDIDKTPKKRKTCNIDSPPQSKRKHIMESMYAKKMLLTYSSSSDTEDEQLRSTLKDIKECLLRGISSDEDGEHGIKDSPEKGDKNVSRSISKDNSSESESNDTKNPDSIETAQLGSDSKETSYKESISGSLSDISSKSKVGRTSTTPDGNCSQYSEIQDTHDKEIDGLTNLSSLNKISRRRKRTSTENAQRTRFRRSRRMAKASGLISNEGFLEAESSSDAASLSGSDHADNADLEDVPRVNLTDINGDGIEHLAKDDLLGESDTSVSHEDKKSYKKEEDTDEDNVKSKRRKAIAISSDSEAGSSRRKDNNVRLSDFEDTEDESSEPVKNKRKKKPADSDASGGSSDDGKKKRRRIKALDESEGSGSDTENEGRNKHGRKNIRKVMSKNQLEEATKKAAREEKERIARIAERQKLYNNLEFDESGKPDEVVLEKVVLDFDPETKEPLIQVDRGLVKKLKPHQANGIKFMWNACFESVKRIKKDKGSGCILAHCMGLGKTLQVVSLTHTLLTHGSLTGVNRVLVVCPLSTVLNWVNEFRMWLKHAETDFEVDVYELSKFKQNSERAFQLSQWFEHGGVCVLGYEMFRNLSADKGKKFKKKILKNFQESLVDPGPDLVVCDEGHLLKNEKTSLSQSMNRVKTRRRIVLTGTPLQNNLKEYYCMVQFVKPNLLGKYNEYLNRFVNPITNGQYTDSTEHDIRVMKRRSHVLHKMLDGAVQRRDYGVLAPFLPPKHEYVLFITLTEVQIKLYHHYLDNYSRQPQPGKSSGFLFPDFQSLQRIWTHPLVLKYNSERYEIMQQKKREREEEDSEGSLVDFIDDSTPEESSTEESSEELSDASDDSRKKSKKKKSGKKGKGKDSKVSSRRGTRANPIDLDEEEPIESLEVKSENPTEWWMKLVSEEELEDMRNSHKLILLFDILRQCEAIGDKLLVFSQSLYSLDLIEHFLGKVDEATQAGHVDEKLGGHVGSWSPGVDYFRLDGSTSCENRSIWCKNFNRVDNQRARLFLISTRAGGLGINLVAANRVVIFDVSWNPSHDVQSIFRVYRFGQKKPCYVYRFLAMGTMEEKIYERQVTKQAISKRVIDEQQIDRHYAENDLAELYKFEPQPPLPRPLPPLPKDRLFAEMLKEHEAQIYKYHEHDSLLENKEEETLSEEERRAAWEDFENEKTRPPPQPFLSPYAMHNGMGMVQGLLAQQQMAMNTLSAMLRKDMPNVTDQQLRETVPMILAANPGMFGGYDYGLMQKMSEIYKYAQPGMMNPAMMNPMNAGSGMSGGSRMGASALHYEPPWQRQQQEQIRLQQLQLMQQQNSMGAKYYAGGLGSRDPMAMALQQQRARELMHRPRARGRPPLASAAPRAPPAHAGPNNVGDVVNLDSD